MSCEHGNHVEDCDLCDAVDAAYKAGQASVEQRVKELEELVDRQQGFLSYWKAKCAELTRERDEAVRQWERFERMAGDNWAALKAQAGEPVAWQHRQRGLKEYEWQEWQTVGYKPQGPESQTFQMRPLYTHPTTERPYNPLNDYAVISMNPTEPVKAQAGEPVCWIYELSGYRSIAWGSSKPDFPAAKNPVPLYTHPTTERREPVMSRHELREAISKAMNTLAKNSNAWEGWPGTIMFAEAALHVIENTHPTTETVNARKPKVG